MFELIARILSTMVGIGIGWIITKGIIFLLEKIDFRATLSNFGKLFDSFGIKSWKVFKVSCQVLLHVCIYSFYLIAAITLGYSFDGVNFIGSVFVPVLLTALMMIDVIFTGIESTNTDEFGKRIKYLLPLLIRLPIRATKSIRSQFVFNDTQEIQAVQTQVLPPTPATPEVVETSRVYAAYGWKEDNY